MDRSDEARNGVRRGWLPLLLPPASSFLLLPPHGGRGAYPGLHGNHGGRGAGARVAPRWLRPWIGLRIGKMGQFFAGCGTDKFKSHYRAGYHIVF